MSQVFVVTGEAAAVDKEPRLAYATLSSTAAVTASHDSANVNRVHDGMTTLGWKPANSASWVQFDGSFTDTDYLAISGANFGSTACTVTVKDSGGNTLASASGMSDNQPVFFVFTKATYTVLKVEFTCTNTSLEVGEIYFGESMQFPKNVSVGYQPGRWTSNDIVTTGRTETNQFAGSIVRARGTTESFTINHVPTSFMEADYKNFMNASRGIPVFFLWDKSNTTQAVFGTWTASKPTFTSSLLSSISLTINGVA